MPRKPKKSVSEIYEALKELNFVEENSFRPYNDPIWQRASDLLDGVMNKSYVYMYITQNRNGIQNKLYGKTIGSVELNTSKNISDQSIHSNWSMNESKQVLSPIRTEMHISKCEWDKIDPCIVSYKDRAYEMLKPGWSDIIYDHIWNQLKLPCPFHFKNAKVNRTPGEIFLQIKGKCSECNSEINIYGTDEPSSEGMRLQISTYDTRNVIHAKKRQLRGNKRKNVVKEVIAKSTYTWRRDKANELMKFGDVEPANLYSEDVLRKAKQLYRDEELGVSKERDPISSLIKIKYGLEFAGCIHQIGIDKFYTMYWSQEQIFLFKEFMKNNDTGSISIDATGSLIKSLLKPDDSKAPIFLYQAVASLNGKILSVFQMISEKHDANMLTYWMREWLRSGVPCPKQVVTDFSLALLNAVALSFNNTDLQTYINNCMNMLLRSGKLKKATCMIRIDIAHLIKLICRWPCFTHAPAVKDFFVRCIGILSKCTTINNFSSLCIDVLTVSFSPLEDIEDNNNYCFNAQQRLIKIIKTNTEIYNATESDLFITFTDSEEETNMTHYSEIDLFLQNIEKESKKENSGTRPNPYYCPDFGKRLLKLCRYFLLWTAVCSTTDKNLVATSACSEEYFREVKNLIFNDNKSNRIDKFIILHLRSLAGTMKLLNVPNKPPSQHKTKSDQAFDEKEKSQDNFIDNNINTYDNGDYSLDSESNNFNVRKTNNDKSDLNIHDVSHDAAINHVAILNEMESWRGKNKIKKRGKYLVACPDIQNLHKRPKYTNTPLLINGNALPPAKIDNKRIMVKNTCPFDATVQCIIGGYSDWPEYNKYIEETCNATFIFIKNIYKTGLTQKAYNARATIMHSIISPEHGILDCATNVSFLATKLMHDVPSIEFLHKCNDCGFVKKDISLVLSVNTVPFYQNGMKGIQEAVNQCAKIKNLICNRCKSKNITFNYNSGKHMFIDIECLENEQLAFRLGYPDSSRQYTLAELSNEIYFCEKQYKLVAAVIYIGGTIGHYIAYVRKITGKWQKHDGLATDKKPCLITDRELLEKKRIHLLFYIKN